MEKITIKASAPKSNETKQCDVLPWYDRIANSVVDAVTDHLSDREELKLAAEQMRPKKEAERKARSRARAIAWAKTQGFELTYED